MHYQSSKPTVICLTPVKNEAWILERFLRCASLWADHIIIADQQSTDGSREIAAKYPKVTLIDNSSKTFNEPERQKLLLEAARRIPGPRLLIALDADEMLTGNFSNSPEWNTLIQAPIGTVIAFDRANLQPNFQYYWREDCFFCYGFLDDGSEHTGEEIHSPRIPVPAQAPIIKLRDIKVLHYQYTDWERMKSKHRWYQCWELLNRSSSSFRAIKIHRLYHHMYTTDVHPILKEWFLGYEHQGIDMTSTNTTSIFWWDKQILDWLAKYGADTFKKLDIWDVDWSILFSKINPDSPPVDYKDPRSKLDKCIHLWLKKTQRVSSRRSIVMLEKLLGFLGW